MVLKLKQIINSCKGQYTTSGLVLAFYYALLSFDFVAITAGVSVGRIAALATAYLLVIVGRSWRFRFETVDWLIALFSFVSLCSLFFLPAGHQDLGPYLTIALNILILAIGRLSVFEGNDLRLWKNCLVGAALVLGIAAIVSPGQVGTEWVSGRVVPNIAGSQQDPNEFCGYYLLPLSLFTIKMFETRKIVFALPIAFFAYTVLMTGSRGGLIAVVAAFLIALFYAVRNDKHGVLICGIAVILVLFIVLNFNEILSLLPREISSRFDLSAMGTGSAETRMNIWRQLLVVFSQSNPMQQLFGHGYGATVLSNSAHLVAHNVYIELLFDIGIVGLGSFLGMFAIAIVRASRRKDYALVAALVGEAVLLASLSSFWSKTLWGLFLLSFAIEKNGEKRVEHRITA